MFSYSLLGLGLLCLNKLTKKNRPNLKTKNKGFKTTYNTIL